MKCFRFIAAEKANHSISLMCRLLGGSRSAFMLAAAAAVGP